MSATMLHACRVLFAVVPLLLGGCVSYYRAETVLHADGSVDRAIYQPAGNAANLDEQRGQWTELRTVDELDDRTWRPGISELPAATGSSGDSKPYRAAWGHFTSPTAIPAHVQFAAPDGKEAGELVRTYQRTDLGLVVEYLWEETLTDIVTLPGAQQAIEQMVDSLAADLDMVLEQGLGPDYDREPILGWVNGDGRQWLHDAVAALYDVAARRLAHAEQQQRLTEELLDLSVPYGLDLRDEHGNLRQAVRDGGEKAVFQTLVEFAKQKLRTLLRRHDGQPVPASVWNELDAVLDELIPSDASEVRDRTPSAVTERWTALARAMIEARYKTPEHYEKVYSIWLSRIVGVYFFPLSGEARFRYTLTVPGSVIETTGRLQSENTVSWSFVGTEAFPFGMRMMCRSLAAPASVQQRVLGGERITTREQLSAYAALVHDSEALRAVMRQCAQQGHLGELKQYRDRLTERQDHEGLERLTRLEQLLQPAVP